MRVLGESFKKLASNKCSLSLGQERERVRTFDTHLQLRSFEVFAANPLTGIIPSPSLMRNTGVVASELELLEVCADPHEWSDSERSWLYSLRARTSSAGAEGTEGSGFTSDFTRIGRGL
jgi:hypothetical protein